MLRPDAGLDRTDCRILKRLNRGGEVPSPASGNRINKLLESGYVEETNFGEIAITLHGQLELARWRFRNVPISTYSVSGTMSVGDRLRNIFKFKST